MESINMDTNNIKLIDGIITAITNHIFHRIGELGIIRDIHVRLDRLEAEMHERKPDVEQSLETMLQASTWFDKLIETHVNEHCQAFDFSDHVREVVDNHDFGDDIAEAINNHDLSSQIDDAISENDLVSDSAVRDMFDELFEEKIDTALSRLTIIVK
jgi:hypothetical protein